MNFKILLITIILSQGCSVEGDSVKSSKHLRELKQELKKRPERQRKVNL